MYSICVTVDIALSDTQQRDKKQLTVPTRTPLYLFIAWVYRRFVVHPLVLYSLRDFLRWCLQKQSTIVIYSLWMETDGVNTNHDDKEAHLVTQSIPLLLPSFLH